MSSRTSTTPPEMTMSLQDALEMFKQDVAPDPRVSLCDVEVRGGALEGIAAKELGPGLYTLAAEHGVPFRVQSIEGREQVVGTSRVFVRSRPEADAETVNEALYGERVLTFDRVGDYYRVATTRDQYLGWVPLNALGSLEASPTHRFATLRGHLYAAPKVSAERRQPLALGTELCLLGLEEEWAQVRFGREKLYVKLGVLEPLDKPLSKANPSDIISLARRFLHTPYVWGGISAWGLDCSGLVQSVYGAFGVPLPRDADQQAACGEEVATGDVQHADLLFFPGHVAIALGGTRFIHANAHHMSVTIDDFEADAYGQRLREKLTKVVRLGLES